MIDPTDPLVTVIDERHFDKLYAMRLEGLFHPNPDGSPSARGEVIFHTEIWHFRDGVVFAKSRGPIYRQDFDSLMPREWGMSDGTSIETPTILESLESVFRGVAGSIPSSAAGPLPPAVVGPPVDGPVLP